MPEFDPPTPYRVLYSEAVEQRLRELSQLAFSRGDGRAFLAALKVFRDRLPIYPQFGEPLFDLKAEAGQIYNGVVPPIVMRYGVFEERRLVFCGSLPVLLSMARPDVLPDE